MAEGRFNVVKIKGTEPEVFWIVWWPEPPVEKGLTMQASGDLSEDALRLELTKMGKTDSEIDALIQTARDNPR